MALETRRDLKEEPYGKSHRGCQRNCIKLAEAEQGRQI